MLYQKVVWYAVTVSPSDLGSPMIWSYHAHLVSCVISLKFPPQRQTYDGNNIVHMFFFVVTIR